MSERVGYVNKYGELSIQDDRDTKMVESLISKTYKVKVTDFDMPFGNMIMFMVKWALAALPAVLILMFGAMWAGSFIVSFLGSFD